MAPVGSGWLISEVMLTVLTNIVRSKEQEKETEKPRKNAQEKVVNRTKKMVNCGK